MGNKVYKEINEMLALLDKLADDINNLRAKDFNDLKWMIKEYEELWETIDNEFSEWYESHEADYNKHFDNLKFFTELS